MSEVISGVLKLTFGLISNKLRAYGAEKLQDGGLTNQKFRGWIVRELDDIKSKLDAISRKDLCASISFLQQGVQRLNLSFGESAESGDPSSSELSSTGASSTSTKPAQPSVTIEDAVALASAVGKLKLDSNQLFELAKKPFEEAGKQATLAFHNAALSTEERVLSSKVRIASSILEHLDHTEVAASDCLHYLQKLHNMPAIQEIFSVHIQGGIKSLFKKTSRAEIVETVTMINLILADFISKFTKRRMAVFDWPLMQCGKLIVHPIHWEEESVQKMREMEITPPWDIVECKTHEMLWQEYALNSKGDIIRVCRDDGGHIHKLDRATGEWQSFWRSDDGISSKKSIAIGDDDIVYVVSVDYYSQSLAPDQDDSRRQIPKLSAYSSDGKIILQRTLDFIPESHCKIAVTNDKKIVIGCGDIFRVVVYVCDIKGELIKRFVGQHESLEFLQGPFTTCDNEITIALQKEDSLRGDVNVILYVLSQEGEFKRTSSRSHLPTGRCSHLPTGRWLYSITFDHATKNHIVCRQSRDDHKMQIKCLVLGASELVLNSIFLDNDKHDKYWYRLISHRNGAMALVNPQRVLYLRSPSM